MTRPHPSEEPAAAVRQFARTMREMYVALVQEGFTEQQSMSAITTVIQSVIKPPTT